MTSGDLVPGVLGKRNLVRANPRSKCSSKPPASGEPLSASNGAIGYYVPGKAAGGKWQKMKKASVQSCFEACAERACEAFVYSAGSRQCKVHRKNASPSSAIKFCKDMSTKKSARVVGFVSRVRLEGLHSIVWPMEGS